MVKEENLLNGECTKSKLWLFDLAGSERVAKTEVQGERLKETQNINKFLAMSTYSLLPSKALTFLSEIQNLHTCFKILLSKRIELGPAKKQLDNTELLKYKQMVEKWKQVMKGKNEQIRKIEEMMYSLEAKIKERDTKNKTLHEKVKELESQLLVERKLARQHVDTKIAEQQTKQQTGDENNTSKRMSLANIPLESPSKENVNLMESTTSCDLALLPNANGGLDYNDFIEKENNPEMADKCKYPRKQEDSLSVQNVFHQLQLQGGVLLPQSHQL